MNAYNAVAMAEGRFEEIGIDPEDVTEEDVLEAWQYLIDTDLAWQLQGSFGRTAMALINQGLCTMKQETRH